MNQKNVLKTVSTGVLGLAVLASGMTAYATSADPASSTPAANTTLFSVAVNNGAGTIAYTPRFEDYELRGPESFAVATNGDVYLLDTIDAQVEIFAKDGAHKATVTLPTDKEFFDIELTADGFYVLSDTGAVLQYKGGQLVSETAVPVNAETLDLVGLYQNKKHNVVVRYLDGSELEIATKQKYLGHGGYVGKRTGNAIELQGADRIKIDYTYEPAGTQPLVNVNGEEYVLENEAVIGASVYVETKVGTYKNGKRTGTALALPTQDYAVKVPSKHVYAAANGNVYQMVLKDGAVEIVQLGVTSAKRTHLNKQLVDRVLKGESTAQTSAAGMIGIEAVNAYTRTTAYNRAYDITAYSWTFNSANRTPTTSTTVSPDYLASAATGFVSTGIPYCWGGFDSLDTSSSKSYWSNFAGGLAAGKDAGNIHTSGHNWISSTVGLDCSGFISAIYGFSYKFSTGMLASDPNTPFKPSSYSLLQPGDIANDAGNHVWVYISKKYDSANNLVGYYTREATISGTNDKAKYYSRSLSEAQGYVPMTLK